MRFARKAERLQQSLRGFVFRIAFGVNPMCAGRERRLNRCARRFFSKAIVPRRADERVAQFNSAEFARAEIEIADDRPLEFNREKR